ncbi:MAG: Ig-like domain-containing protein [Lachnospiraceae bacterium]|nr:Ig-like domain-containing protein [Lachnospiraceae bacterium]
MKKLFGQNRKPYDEDVNMEEWDYGEDEYAQEEIYEGDESEMGEYYADEEGYESYEGDETYEDEEFYEGEEVYEDGEAYEDEDVYEDGVVYEDEVVYADEEFAEGESYEGEEVYADEEVYEDGEAYEEEVYEDEVYEEEYYEAQEYEDDALEYEDEAAYEDDIDGVGFFGRIGQSIMNMSIIDKIVTTTGVVVLILALVTGGIYVSANMADRQVSSFGSVGTQLSGLTMIGEEGLFAVADAIEAQIKEANAAEDDDKKDYNENDYSKDVNVVMNMTSIQNDLKVKFVNKRTNKLIGNIPFSVEVTTPKGKTEVWTDDDMDGIIYKKGIDAGGYTILMSALEGEKYEKYNLPESGKKVEVKKEIEYEKVDVADEIKTESEINAKVEDTAQKETVVESELKDTVTWVESTKSTTYVAVAKKDIKDPSVASIGTKFYRLAGEMSISGGGEMAPGSTLQLSASKASDYADWTVSDESWKSDVASVTVDSKGLVTASADITEAKNVTITYTCTLTKPVQEQPGEGTEGGETGEGGTEDNVSGGDGAAGGTGGSTPETTPETTPESKPETKPESVNVTVTHQITVTPVILVKELTVAPATLVLDLSKGVSVGELTATVVTSQDSVSKDVTWSSSNEKVATVKVENGKAVVTAVSAGTATITATSVADSKVAGTCEVTVSGAAMTALQLDKTSASIPRTGTVQLKAITTPEGCPVTWSSDKTEVATVDDKGLVTGLKEGTATITAKGVDATGKELSAKCTVTVTQIITLDKTTLTVIVGGESTINATFTDGGKGELKAYSADTSVVQVEVKDNKTVVFKGIAPKNSVGVTIVYTTTAGEHINTDIAVSVVSNTNKLVDSQGQQLYVLGSDGKYVAAVASDYYKYDTFYVQTTRYTGWQTIGGEVMYFDVNGKYVTGEQVIQGAKYNFASDGTLITGAGTMGIDVSKWNGTIDWNAVKNSGVSYVIIRCGYRGSSSGALVEDPKFKNNIKGATAAGLKVGVYFFTQAVDEIEAIEEASMVLELIEDYKISYPVFLDVEASGGRGDKIDAETRTAVIKAFCETIEDSKYTAGVYANKTWLEKKMDASELTKYKIWLAQYAAQPTYSETKIDLWQYKETGKVSGISGNVDLNLSYLGY